MKHFKLLSTAAVLGFAFAAMPAQAGVVTDAHGNVGYDTAEECDAAVHAGNAKFYQSFTHKKPFIRKGESKVQTAKLSELGEQYKYGACDLGVGHGFGREGVSRALQGKYIPFSPDMPVNVYMNKSQQVVRVSMSQCDNRFSENAPRPVPAPAPVAKVEEPAPAPVPTPAAEVVAPVAAAPVVASAFRPSPYVFGTVGATHSAMNIYNSGETYKDRDIAFAGQGGLGVQLTKNFGVEGFYQGGEKYKYDFGTGNKANVAVNDQTYGARLTAGLPVGEKVNFFAKAGVAEVKHKATINNGSEFKHKQTLPTAGLGMTYGLTDNLKLRADYDHFFSRRKNNAAADANTYAKWKCSDYVGVGLQYNF